MAFTLKPDQVFVASILRVGFPLKAFACNLDIEADILDQALFTDIIILRSYEAQDQEIHPRSVEIPLEAMENVHFLSLVFSPNPYPGGFASSL